MNEKTFCILNQIYRPVLEKSEEIKNALKSKEVPFSSGFYNNHYIRHGHGFVQEYFPIPVISISKIGDIGIDIDTIWIEMILPKETALLLDYQAYVQSYSMEVYGALDYLQDFYHAGSDAGTVAEKISSSAEEQICITFYFEMETDVEQLIDVIDSFIDL